MLCYAMRSRGIRVADMFTILVVEDDLPIAEAFHVLLSELGYAVILAFNGRQALEIAVAQSLDLIITDLMMPRLSGAEFITKLRGTLAAVPPIIVISAADSSFARAAGADRIILKPFDITEVERTVDELLHP